MPRKRPAEELSVEELRQLLIEKRRTERSARIDRFRRNGRIIQVEPQPLSNPIENFNKRTVSEEWLVVDSTPAKSHKSWINRLLTVVEIVAVVGLVIILFNGFNLLRSLNQEVAVSLTQPTLTPTPLITAIILPSGHTPPTDSGGARPNNSEIPEHLKAQVQSLANIPVPTASPEQAIRIQINAISVDAPVVQGDGWEQLKKGVGTHIGSPDPGEAGNIVFSAHNDVFGEIFRDLDKLKPGDEVLIYSNQRAYTYIVQQTQIVEPTQVEVMAQTHEPIVTLISCYPYLVDDQRIVVTALLQE